MPSRKREISLLPSSENTNSLVSRTLTWVTTVGRVIIVMTELIVITAFLSRFWLDRQNSDLSEVVRQQKAILGTTVEFQKEYGILQKQLVVIDKIYNSRQNLSSYIKKIAQSLPEPVTLNSISSSSSNTSKNPKLNIEVQTLSDQAIIDLIENLALHPQVIAINVGNIEKKTKDQLYRLSLSVEFKTDVQ